MDELTCGTISIFDEYHVGKEARGDLQGLVTRTGIDHLAAVTCQKRRDLLFTRPALVANDEQPPSRLSALQQPTNGPKQLCWFHGLLEIALDAQLTPCLLYTSDAADE